MQIVIDINENDYKTLMINGGKCTLSMAERIVDSVYHGKKLQEPVLDKIRAEIIDKSYLSYDDNPRHIIDESWVLEIIDKYKAESEE